MYESTQQFIAPKVVAAAEDGSRESRKASA